MTAKIVVLGGSGDAYLVCALMNSFARQHGRSDVEVVLRRRLAPVADLFGVSRRIDDDLVTRAEQQPEFQRSYDNAGAFLSADYPYYAHPSFVRSSLRIDKLTTKPEASQADMYRVILRLPHDAPLDLPLLPRSPRAAGTAVMITDSTSWPNLYPEFWTKLARGLERAGWHVAMNDPRWTLGDLLARCAGAEWVLGPQCGVMSILAAGRFPCRKTLATPNIDGNVDPAYLAAETFPYGYVTKFDGHDYDVDEFKIRSDNHAELVGLIVNGPNGRRLWPHDPRPVRSISMPLSPGEFLDRLAVLTVKRENFSPERRAAIEREYQRHAEAQRQAGFGEEVDRLFGSLVDVHRRHFNLLELTVPAALKGKSNPKDYSAAVKLNHERGLIKGEIDAATHAPYHEVKSYYPKETKTAPPARPASAPALSRYWTKEPEPVGHANGHAIVLPSAPKLVASTPASNIVEHQRRFYVVPKSIGPIELDKVELARYPGIIACETLAGAMRAAKDGRAV